MKDADFKGKSSPPGFGKGLLIAIVVVFSSMSFVLGYFVGKVGRDDRAAQHVRAGGTAVPVTPDVQPAPPVKADAQPLPAAPADRAVPATSKKAEGKASRQPPASVVTEQPAAQKKVPSKEEKYAGRASGRKAADVYTVQLGALRKAAEAKRLRAKFVKKGYKTFLIAAKNKKREKIYKVRVGEFRRKKDAEILALKLKKTEGLKAFVTVKN